MEESVGNKGHTQKKENICHYLIHNGKNNM